MPMGVEPTNLFLGTAKYYSQYRPRYPEALFDHLARFYGLSSSTIVADVGAGTGQIAIPLARRHFSVVAIDPQPEMLAEAKAVAVREGVRDRVRWVLGRGEDLPRHVHAPLRLVTLGQCFHWLDRDGFLERCDAVVEEGGGVAIISGGREAPRHGDETVPSGSRAAQPEWAAVVTSVIRQFLEPPPPRPWVCHEEVLARSRFNQVKRWQLGTTIVRTVDEIIGLQYSTSFCSPALLGDRQPELERLLRQRLLELEPSNRFTEEYTVDALCALRS